MRDGDALLLVVLFLAFGNRNTTPETAPPARAPNKAPVTDRWLDPGVYWYCAGAAEAPELVKWFQTNVGMARLGKLLGSNGADCAVVLFEVIVPCIWTLANMPGEAPFGLDTTLADLEPEPSLADFFRRKAKQTLEAIKAFDARIQQWLDSVLRPSPTQ
jgi:hypothetical protein